MTPSGLCICRSAYGPAETSSRLQSAIAERGMTIMARIDHTAEAVAVGMQLRPTELLIFGNARAGTLLMNTASTIAIDLPLKALIWKDEAGRTWLAYNDPNWIAERHGAETGCEATLKAMAEALAISVNAATTNATPVTA